MKGYRFYYLVPFFYWIFSMELNQGVARILTK
jgi:hypothetical protein